MTDLKALTYQLHRGANSSTNDGLDWRYEPSTANNPRHVRVTALDGEIFCDLDVPIERSQWVILCEHAANCTSHAFVHWAWKQFGSRNSFTRLELLEYFG